MIKSLEKFSNLESVFMKGIQNLPSCFFIGGGRQSNQKTGSKKYMQAVYNSDYMPLLKIGGYLSTKIRKSKTQKTSYHLHHATISRFHQPHLPSPITLNPTTSAPTPSLHTPTHHTPPHAIPLHHTPNPYPIPQQNTHPTISQNLF